MSAAHARQRVGRQQLARLRTELSDRDLALLASVADWQLLSARQLQRLHFPPSQHTPLGAARSSRRVLARLVEARALLRLDRRVGGVRAGSASFIYALGPVGQRLLREAGPRPRAHEPSLAFVNHTLAIAELVVRLVEAERAGQLVLLGAQPEPRCWRRYLGPLGNPEVLRPDLRLTVATGDTEYHWFVEVDRGTEHLPAIRRKCWQYAAYYRSGEEQMRSGIFPRVAWLTTTQQRALTIRGAITTTSTLPDGLFVVSPLNDALELLRGADGDRA